MGYSSVIAHPWIQIPILQTYTNVYTPQKQNPRTSNKCLVTAFKSHLWLLSITLSLWLYASMYTFFLDHSMSYCLLLSDYIYIYIYIPSSQNKTRNRNKKYVHILAFFVKCLCVNSFDTLTVKMSQGVTFCLHVFYCTDPSDRTF